MGKRKISVDIEENSLKHLDKIEKLADRDRSYLIRKLIKDNIDDLEAYYVAMHRLADDRPDSWITLEEARKKLEQKKAKAKGKAKGNEDKMANRD
jgi:predicted DNA-binding protein